MFGPSACRALLICTVAVVAAGLVLFGADSAAAAVHGSAIGSSASIFSPITSVFKAITGAALGAFSWTISLATKFILVTLAALVRMLIPRSWATEGVEVFQWIVQVPNFAGQVSSPGGGQQFGFAGVNDMRQLLEWIGLGLLPLTLVYATGRAMVGEGDHVAAPVARVVGLAALLASYTLWWQQGAALVNQVTSLILSPAAVTGGIHQLMAYATEGVALGGWQLIDLSLMAALALELLGLIFVKVVVILLGAILYAAGPLMIGVVPTEHGSGLARAWLSATLTLLLLPVAWAIVFAIGAVLVGDASTAGPLIGGSSPVGQLLGGVIVAVAGAATLWLCLKAAKELGGILRLQLGALLAVRSRGRSTSTATRPSMRGGQAASSIRQFQGRVRDAGQAALLAGGGSGAGVAAALGGAGRIGHRGLIRSGAGAAGSATLAGGRAAARSRIAQAARPQDAAAAASAAIGSPTAVRVGRAGAVASRMARAGTASWRTSRTPAGHAAKARDGQNGSRPGSPTTGRGRSDAQRGGAGAPAPPRPTPHSSQSTSRDRLEVRGVAGSSPHDARPGASTDRPARRENLASAGNVRPAPPPSRPVPPHHASRLAKQPSAPRADERPESRPPVHRQTRPSRPARAGDAPRPGPREQSPPTPSPRQEDR